MSKALPFFSHKGLVRGAALLGAGALAVFVPRSADACEPPLPILVSSIPADGATYPGNAGLVFKGIGIELDGVDVTVDGQPAKLLLDTSYSSLSDVVAVIEPEPAEGQTVVLSGTFCDSLFCEPTMITYTVGAPDVDPPAPDVEASFVAVYDHADYEASGGDCASDSDLTYYIHLAHAGGEGAATLFRVAYTPEGEDTPAFERTVTATDDTLRTALSVVSEQLAGKRPEEVCLDVTALDTAGNATGFQLCPCFFRQDDIVHNYATPDEPAWMDADGVPGSACAAESATSEGETSEGETSEGETSEGEATAGPTTGPTTGAPTSSDGSSGDEGSSGGSDGGATGGADDKGDGCACSSDGGEGGAGRSLLFVLGLGLARVRRRR
jgi:MYXO-CTERM domain-containing protein